MIGEDDLEDALVTGKVYQVSLAKIIENKLYYTMESTHFFPLDKEEVSCQCEKEFINSADLRSYEKDDIVNQVLPMKIIDKYIPETKKGKKKRGIVKLIDYYTKSTPTLMTIFGSDEHILKVLDSAVVGEWVKLSGFLINEYKDVKSIIYRSNRDLTLISDIKNFPWLSSGRPLPKIKAAGGLAKGKIHHFTKTSIYKSCKICEKSEFHCYCGNKRDVVKKFSFKVHFISTENEKFEFNIHQNTLKEFFDDQQLIIKDQETVENMFTPILLNKQVEIKWFKDKNVYDKIIVSKLVFLE